MPDRIASVAIDNVSWTQVTAPVDADSFNVSCKDAVDDLQYKFSAAETNFDLIVAGVKLPFTQKGGFVYGQTIGYFRAATGAATVLASPNSRHS